MTIRYLKETEDYGFLDDEVPYRDGDPESIWKHCLNAIDLSLSRRSERGLPLILGGDWNDGMNAVGTGGHGESVWVAQFLCAILPDIVYLARRRGEEDVAARYEEARRALADAVNTHAGAPMEDGTSGPYAMTARPLATRSASMGRYSSTPRYGP